MIVASSRRSRVALWRRGPCFFAPTLILETPLFRSLLAYQLYHVEEVYWRGANEQGRPPASILVYARSNFRVKNEPDSETGTFEEAYVRSRLLRDIHFRCSASKLTSRSCGTRNDREPGMLDLAV